MAGAGLPVAATIKCVTWPGAIVWFAGWVVMAGAMNVGAPRRIVGPAESEMYRI